jgi:acyl carrier protein
MNTQEIDFIKSLIIKETNFSENQIQDYINVKMGALNIDSLSLLSICSEIEDKYKIQLISTAKDIKELNIKERTFNEFIEFIEFKIQKRNE